MMKTSNPYESPVATAMKNPVRGPNYLEIEFRYFVILFWALIPLGSVMANLFLKPFYNGYPIDLSVISRAFFDWKTPYFLAIPAMAIILAMVRMRPGLLRFCLAMIAVFFGSMVVCFCGLAYWLPWASLQAGLGR